VSKTELRWDTMTPMEREEYVNQDHVGQHELVSQHIENMAPPEDPYDSFWGCVLMDTPNKIKRIIIVLHEDGLSVNEITYHVPSSKSWIRKILKKYKDENRRILVKNK
jgi:hypothetical protein